MKCLRKLSVYVYPPPNPTITPHKKTTNYVIAICIYIQRLRQVLYVETNNTYTKY